jgi:hypothetical protein
VSLLDLPVSSFDEDRFEHRRIAEALADYIHDPSSELGSAIAVTGGWGTGKSGILNLLVATFQERSMKPDDGTRRFKPIFIWFRPWLIGSKDALIASLFGQLVTAIGGLTEGELPLGDIRRPALRAAIQRLRERVINFSEIASITSGAVANFDTTGTAAVFSMFSRTAGSVIKKITRGKRSLEKERDDLVYALKEVVNLIRGLRFVVLVDDIDRLEPMEIVEIIRLVRSVAALPHVTYVLAFDKPVVEGAIEKALRIERGADFLEKVIHIHLPVPALPAKKLPTLLESYLREMFRDDADFSSRRARNTIHVWGGRLLKSPRDVKRLVAGIVLIWPSLRSRADFLDFVWIELLKLRASTKDADLYSWVRSYMMSVEHMSFGGLIVGEAADAAKLGGILQALGWATHSGDVATGEHFDYHQLSSFLPGISNAYIELNKAPEIYKLENRDTWRTFATERRLGSPRHWRYYFGFAAPDSAVTGDLIEGIFQSGRRGRDELIEALRNLLVSTGANREYPADQVIFENLEPRIVEMTDVEAGRWLEAILVLAIELDEKSAATFVAERSNFKLGNRRLLASLLQRVEVVDRVTRIRDLMRIPTATWALADFFEGELRLHREKETRPGDFDSEHVFEARALSIVTREFALSLNGMTWEQLIAQHNPWGVLFSWWDIRHDEAAAWLRQELLDSDKFIERLAHLVTHSYSADVHDHLPEHYLDHFVSSAEVRGRLEAIATSDNPEKMHATRLLSIWTTESSSDRGSRHSRVMGRMLLNNSWTLVYDPERFEATSGARGSKPMMFDADGLILDGANQNEAAWRIKGDFLEFLNEAGNVHSRFRFRLETRDFIHTDEADTKAIKGQYMIPITQVRRSLDP